MEKTAVSTDQAPAAIGPYSQGIAAGNLVFCSGQGAIDPTTRKTLEGDVQAQTRLTLENLKAVLTAAGTDLNHVVKTTVFLTDIGNFQAMNAIYAEYFPETPPARSTVGVKALPLGLLVEIECIAVRP